MPYNIYFLQIQKDLQAAAFAAADKTVSNRFIRKSYYNLYRERCMEVDEYAIAGGPLGMAVTNGFLIVLLWNLAGLAILLHGLRRDAADPQVQPV